MSTLEQWARFRAILARIDYKDWILHVGADDGRCYLQVRFERDCVVTGERGIGHGRKWFLSPHMTDSEVVGTAMMAVLAIEEHEARELFRYRGHAVFGPHMDVDRLVDAMEAGHIATSVRAS